MTSRTSHGADPGPSNPPTTVTAGDDPPLADALDRLAAAVVEEMTKAASAGDEVRAEAWFQRHPILAADEQSAVRLVFEEICLREEQGEHVDSDEVYARFPQWKQALAIVLDCHRLIDVEPAPLIFPEAGEQIGELRLVRELGRGGQGRVFLAIQPSLSDRPLVVKLTPRRGDEHLSLARLQHTHVAPLYLVQDFPEQNLRALCMPFLGGASWASLLQGMSPIPPAGRRGSDIVEQLERLPVDLPSPPTSGGPALAFLGRAATSMRSAGLVRAWPTVCNTPISVACCIWISSRRTFCWPPMASRCCSTFIWHAKSRRPATNRSSGSAVRAVTCRLSRSWAPPRCATGVRSPGPRRPLGYLLTRRVVLRVVGGAIPEEGESLADSDLRRQPAG